MRKILLIGACGAGKSTLARQLAEILDLPVTHLDRLWWRPGWVIAPRDQFDAALEEALQGERWILDGTFGRTLPRRLACADTVIHLRVGRLPSMAGILKRILKSHGRSRPDLAEGCPERLDWAFLRYAWHYNRDQLPRIEAALAGRPASCRLVELQSRRDIDDFVQRLRNGRQGRFRTGLL